MNIALCSPNRNAYSETFIQAHKERLNGNIFYYYGGKLPENLESGVVINSRKKRILDIIKGHYQLNDFTLSEQALISSFKKNEIDLVFAEYGGTGEKVLAVSKELNLPLIVHFHGYDATQNDEIKSNKNYKGIFEYASYIIAVSKKMESQLLDLGCPKEKLVYNVYGPNEDFLDVKRKSIKPQFIAAGRFVDKKAPYYLILTFLAVIKEFPDAKLIIAGEGKLWNTCKNLVAFYGLQDHIELPGIISRSQFQEYLSQSLAFVQHSIMAQNGDSEGTPLVILEAGAAGVPVVSTKHAGIPDVVINEETGFLVEEHDVEGMAEKMLLLLQNKELVVKMGNNAKERIKAHFSLQRHIDMHNDLIQNVLNNY